MGKIQRFSACRGEEYFTTPHSTSRRGGFSFTPSPSRPTGGTKLAQHAQNTPNRAISGEQGEFCRVYRHGSHVSQVTCCHTCRKWWGFCTTRSLPGVCHRRVGASCRAIPPRLVVVRPRLEAVWCPKCRPPRRKAPKTGCRGRGGLRFGHNGACRGVLFARKTLNMRVNPLRRTSTPQHVRGRSRPRTSHRAHVRSDGRG